MKRKTTSALSASPTSHAPTKSARHIDDAPSGTQPLAGYSIHLHKSLPHIHKRLPLLSARISALGGRVATAPNESGVTHVVANPDSTSPLTPPRRPPNKEAPTADQPAPPHVVQEAWLTSALAKEQTPPPEQPFVIKKPNQPPQPEPPPAPSPPTLIRPPVRQQSQDLPPRRDFTPTSSPAAKNPAHPPIRVVTYNILADKYLREGRSHTHCQRQYRTWGSRGPRLKAELQHYAAHLLCLQEVDQPLWDKDLAPWFQEQGYAGWFQGREYRRHAVGSVEGVALLFNTAVFRPLAHRLVRFADHVSAEELQGAGANFWEAVRSKEEGAVLALLQHKATGRVVMAACTHLWYDPKWPDLKVAQSHILCHQIAAFLQATRQAPGSTPLILAGDFNSLPLKSHSDAFDHIPRGEPMVSGVYTLLTQGALTADHPHHPFRRNRLSPDPQALKKLHFSSAGLKLASSWVLGKGHEPPFTNRHSSFAGCIDYVWVGEGAAEVVGLLEMPYAYDPKRIEPRSVSFEFTPNELWPSDHLAVGAELVLK